jgi:hypothetical protein
MHKQMAGMWITSTVPSGHSGFQLICYMYYMNLNTPQYLCIDGHLGWFDFSGTGMFHTMYAQMSF